MANFVEDSFTDTDNTDLAAHAPLLGGDWHELNANGVAIVGNVLVNDNFADNICWNDAVPPTADYSVSAMISINELSDAGQRGVVARYDSTAGDGYAAYFNAGDGNWHLGTFTGVSPSDLGTYSDPGFTSGSKVVTLTLVGDSLSLLVDSEVRVAVTDSTHTSAGFAGLYFLSGFSDGGVIDVFIAGDAPAPLGDHVVTGRGNFAISSPLWLSIAISGRPGNLTSGQAEPPNWYHVGMVSWGTDNGAMVAYPITRDLDLVQLPAGMTTLWFEFANGISATITELAAP